MRMRVQTWQHLKRKLHPKSSDKWIWNNPFCTMNSTNLNPVKIFRREDFPAPLGPIIAVSSPDLKPPDTPLRMCLDPVKIKIIIVGLFPKNGWKYLEKLLHFGWLTIRYIIHSTIISHSVIVNTFPMLIYVSTPLSFRWFFPFFHWICRRLKKLI